MSANNTYSKFVQEVKQQILESRYNAARLVNKELLLLYYNIGKMLHEKIKQAKWGDKVLQNISADLQKELPGLRGFSAQNIKKMRIFYEAYPMLLQHTIGSSTTNQFENMQKDIFYLLSFTHLDEHEKLPSENNSIGIILCKEKNNKIVEYAFKSIDKSMGVATYKTSRQLPAQFKKVLPNAEALKKLL